MDNYKNKHYKNEYYKYKLIYLLLKNNNFYDKSAIAEIKSYDESNINGRVYIKELSSKLVYVYGKIMGLTPGYHGFHIHEYGDLTNDCKSLGGHYNPHNKNHGGRSIVKFGKKSYNFNKHVGDLGNIYANNFGVAIIDIIDPLIKLRGPFNVIGRSFVVHKDKDDLGLARNRESLKTGNSGKRIGCGIIGTL